MTLSGVVAFTYQIVASITFGYWQHSIAAGIFMFAFTDVLARIAKMIKR